MAERTTYVTEPTQQPGSRAALLDDTVRELLENSRVPADALESVANALKGARSPLDDAEIGRLVAGVIHEPATALAVNQALRAVRPRSAQEILDALARWRKGTPHIKGAILDEIFAVLQPGPRTSTAGSFFVTPKAEPPPPLPASTLISLMALAENVDTSETRDWYRQAIIDAEDVDFDRVETEQLTPLLRRFIERNRDSEARVDLVTVGSAIRKFVAVAPSDEAFEFAAGLLKTDGRLVIPIEVEVEVAKMVVRKLTANPPTRESQYPDLAQVLADLAATYLNPRLLPRPKHGTVALDAVLGIALARDQLATAVFERVQSLSVPWFQKLVARQLAELAAELRRRSGGEDRTELIQSLEDLAVAALPAALPK
jgi:hypothetical protein